MNTRLKSASLLVLSLLFCITLSGQTLSFKIVDTNQDKCYNNFNEITPPSSGQAFFGQDAQFDGFQPAYQDNGDGTIRDAATGLIWDKNDSGEGLNWEAALAWVAQKNSELYLGYNDWRLPNAKEMQSIVDYSRAPQTTSSAAIDPIFNISTIIDEGGNADYPFFWTGTTHAVSNGTGEFGVYVCFGEALGWMEFPP